MKLINLMSFSLITLTYLSFALAGPEKLRSKQSEIAVIFNDPAVSQNWGLVGTDAAKAWRLSRGSKKIVVAIIDTGIDPSHPDLRDNLWVNQGESGRDSRGRDKATNGIDDDRNGFIDDVHGWNFVRNDHDLSDRHGHGTHIAGIIGADGHNGIGISGVSPQVSLMVLKYYDPRYPRANTLANTIKAIRYAVKMNARIINYSGGGLSQSPDEIAAIRAAAEKSILFVAAAGNEHSDSDQRPYYPADYDLPNILSVTAIDQRHQVLPTSNFGRQSVDLAAPGDSIYSTLPGGRYGQMTGTSQATAFATGVAALLMAHNPDLRLPEQLIRSLIGSGDKDLTLIGKTRYQVRLNSYRALALRDRDTAATGVIATNTVRLAEPALLTQPLAPTVSQLIRITRALEQRLVAEKQRPQRGHASEGQ